VGKTAGDTLGYRIRAARKALGMTQAQVAEPGYTRAYISLLEHDHIRPSLKTLQLLAHRLKRPLSYFVDGVLAAGSDAMLLCNLADGCLRQRRIEEAELFLKQGFAIAKELKDKRILGLLLKKLGWAYKLRRQFKRAQLIYKRAIALLEEYGEPADVAEAVMYLGNVMCDTGRFKEALALHSRALDTIKDLPDACELRFKLHHNLGRAYMGIGDQEKAFECFTSAVDSSAETTDHYLRGIAHMGAAMASKDRGDLDRALDLSSKALEMFDVKQNLEAIAGIYNNIGSIYHARKEYDRAEEHYIKSIEMGSQLPGASAEATSLHDMALLRLEQGEVDEALSFAEKASKAATRCADASLIPQTKLMLARVLRRTGRYDEVRSLIQTALVAAERTGSRHLVKSATEELKRLEQEEKERSSTTSKGGIT